MAWLAPLIVGSALEVPLADPRTDHGHLGPRLQGFWGWLDPCLPRGDAVEISLEPGRRAEDQYPRLDAAEVGEGVGDAAGSEGQLSPLPREDLVFQLEGELTCSPSRT